MRWQIPLEVADCWKCHRPERRWVLGTRSTTRTRDPTRTLRQSTCGPSTDPPPSRSTCRSLVPVWSLLESILSTEWSSWSPLQWTLLRVEVSVASYWSNEKWLGMLKQPRFPADLTNAGVTNVRFWGPEENRVKMAYSRRTIQINGKCIPERKRERKGEREGEHMSVSWLK